jgi:Macrocin-O-methyltransferase (TylF)
MPPRLLQSVRDRARAARGLVARRRAAPQPEPIDYERVEEIVRRVAEEVYDRRWGMWHLLRSASAADSARFVLEHIPLHLGKSHFDLRRDAVLAAPEDGLFVEFGVWQGNWLRQLAAMRDVQFFGFDSFEGLPAAWSMDLDQRFDLGGKLPEVPANVELVKGWFHETLPPFLEAHPEAISFAHVDCDLYSSTKTVFDLTGDRFVEGTQLVLDDFMLEPGWQHEEHRAFFEFVEQSGWQFEYTGYSHEPPGCSAAVRLTSRA